ncbi:polyprenol phosphomannose-dependent alpha 1,6 mannosyltransferase MptB [Paractinoplanes rishiriensis]|uniref:polyprenol phosphomannose-dependent alpha 1,6 mannosyltransferase MptB n=1 Tax=Paractinoplanes rishiriensis TaxID=1050105 RepID=UPI0023B2A33C|nr:polyprenol phosphomannose-dependent alpha 1,6 mannosyltransferase MptB [Actinoplanes rishiriensis]
MEQPVTESVLSRPSVLRYLGLFGSVCCAVAGLFHGAGPELVRHLSLTSVLQSPYGPLALSLWTVGLAALCVAWWYGIRLTGRGALSVRWIVVTAALWCLPMLVTLPLGSRDLYAYACQGTLYASGGNPYLQGVSSQPCPWLDSMSVIWRDTPTPYGPVFVVFAGLAVAPGSQFLALAVFRALAVVSLVLLAAVLPVLARRAGAPVDRAMWLVLASPLVSVHLVGGGHNDATTMALLVAGMALLAGRSVRAGALVAGGSLLGLAAAVKPTLGVILPFGALLAAGGPALFPPTGSPGGRWRAMGLPEPAALALIFRRGGAVLASALGTLVLLSYASGLGMGWVTALSGANKAVNWTSPMTGAGITVNAIGKWFGLQWDAVPAARVVALILLAVALVAIVWRTRRESPFYGAALACLAVIFLAPITQPWYLTWPAVLLAVTTVPARWFAGTVVLSMFTILPSGDGSFRYLQVPLSFVMTALVVWVAVRAVRWLRRERADTGDAAPEPIGKPGPVPSR